MKWLVRVALAAFLWIAGVAIWIANPPEIPPGQTADAAIVLGAAVMGREPTPVFAARIDHAVTLLNERRVGRVLFTGGRSPEDSLSEAEAARHYAVAKGVDEETILTEEKSRTTFQNLSGTKAILEREGFASVIIVSDPYHLRRAKWMANDLGIDAQTSATPTTRYRSWSSKLPFLMREVYFVHHYWLFGK